MLEVIKAHNANHVCRKVPSGYKEIKPGVPARRAQRLCVTNRAPERDRSTWVPGNDPRFRIDNSAGTLTGIRGGDDGGPPADLRIDVDEILVDEDNAVIRWTMPATHQGVFRGIEPNGKAVRFTGIDILRIKNRQVVARWDEVNNRMAPPYI